MKRRGLVETPLHLRLRRGSANCPLEPGARAEVRVRPRKVVVRRVVAEGEVRVARAGGRRRAPGRVTKG